MSGHKNILKIIFSIYIILLLLYLIFFLSLIYSISISELNVIPIGTVHYRIQNGLYMNQEVEIINRGIYPIKDTYITYTAFKNNSLISQNKLYLNEIKGFVIKNISIFIPSKNESIIEGIILNGSNILLHVHIKGFYAYLISFELNFSKYFVIHPIFHYIIMNYSRSLNNDTVTISLPVKVSFYYNIKMNSSIISSLIYKNKTISYSNVTFFTNNSNMIYLNYTIPLKLMQNITDFQDMNVNISVIIGGIDITIPRVEL